MSATDLQEVEHPNLELARELIEGLGFETDEIPERLPFPAFIARLPLVAPGASEVELPHADLVVADAGDRIQLVLPNIDHLLDELDLPSGDSICRRLLESSFAFEWVRASLDPSDGELRLSASITLEALTPAHLDEVIAEMGDLLVEYWLERIPTVRSIATSALPN